MYEVYNAEYYTYDDNVLRIIMRYNLWKELMFFYQELYAF